MAHVGKEPGSCISGLLCHQLRFFQSLFALDVLCDVRENADFTNRFTLLVKSGPPGMNPHLFAGSCDDLSSCIIVIFAFKKALYLTCEFSVRFRIGQQRA